MIGGALLSHRRILLALERGSGLLLLFFLLGFFLSLYFFLEDGQDFFLFFLLYDRRQFFIQIDEVLGGLGEDIGMIDFSLDHRRLFRKLRHLLRLRYRFHPQNPSGFAQLFQAGL